MHRFYCEETITAPGQTVQLGKDESKHALQVLRMKVGDAAQLFDGKGLWDAELCEIREMSVFFRVTNLLPSPEASCRVTLWQGLPKADKMEWIVQKGTELGADAFWPVEMERSIARRDKADKDEKKRDRLQKIALEATKQSARACIPQVCRTFSMAEAIRQAEKEGFDAVLLAWEEEHALPLSKAVQALQKEKGELRKLLLIIGPEGGVSWEEYRALQAIGAQAVTLGKRILRTETAGLCGLSVIWAALGEM